ncbi:hypothetical protein CCAL12920_08810 [Campylobacter sp. RM12920]|uniref:Uncharacterized protein n=1 Tax=Campylobacter californiensis TaxID=1032243 RepID=A0ABD4JIR6_9BACT|nr:hypothetical protein [Campylobacter sp. RM12919]MBE2988977.1 hypothetical protein [Campylobacter sp. RM12920]MBE3022925.1 hypothetical protein [Campylobacter sp. 7477a]
MNKINQYDEPDMARCAFSKRVQGTRGGCREQSYRPQRWAFSKRVRERTRLICGVKI